MSVKVVQGLIGAPKAAPAPQVKADPQNIQNSAQAGSAVATAVASNILSSDAVSVTVRSQRSGSSEKIKDFKEAKEVADRTADEIRKGDKAEEAHDGLSSFSGAAHLS